MTEKRTCTYVYECGGQEVSKQDPNLGLMFGTRSCQLKYYAHKKHQGLSPYLSAMEAFRELWRIHVSLTRQVLLEMVHGGSESKKVALIVEELMQNQVDIGNQFRKYYGDEYGDAVTTLLKEHIQLAAVVITELMARAGYIAHGHPLYHVHPVDWPSYQVEPATAYQKWLAQAVGIGKALYAKMSADSPHEQESSFTRAMEKHIEMTAQEFVAEVNGEKERSRRTFQHAIDDIVAFANFLSNIMITDLD